MGVSVLTEVRYTHFSALSSACAHLRGTNDNVFRHAYGYVRR